jgi:pyruvate dehydrogenase E2 component (dihydrolipoamide acetyltransferase)
MTLRDITLPRLGETMETGRLIRWLSHSGQTVRRGEPLLELETDKTIVELPNLHDGVLVELIAREGEDIAVDAVIARMRVDAGDAPALAAAAATANPPGDARATPTATGRGAAARLATGTAAQSDRVAPHLRATPAARARARKLGVELSAVTGTGRRGRVESSDVDRATDPLNDVGNEAPHLGVSEPGQWVYQDSQRGTPREPAPDAPTAILVHGFAADHSIWASVASGLARAGIRVLAPDLPSHGGTTLEAANLNQLSTQLLSWVRELRLDPRTRLHLVGHSLGAVPATALAQGAGIAASSLTLIAPLGIGSEINSEFIHGMRHADSAGAVAHLLHYLGPRSAALSDSLLSSMALEFARGRLGDLAGDIVTTGGTQKINIVRALATLSERIKVRVAVGLDDQIIPAKQAQHLAPRVAAHYFSESGHMPMWDQPGELLEWMLHDVIAN